MSVRRIAVISAGLSQPSSSRLLADRLSDATVRRLTEHGYQVEVQVIELRELARDITNNLLTGFPAPALREVLDRVAEADALIAVTPIFSASYSGLFKSFFDILEPDALTDLPVLIGATGGTSRHSLVLEHAVRPLFSYLHAVAAPTGVYAAAEDWGGAADNGGALQERIERAAAQFTELVARSDRTGRGNDPFAGVLAYPTDAPTGS